jgi:hypothetical protein
MDYVKIEVADDLDHLVRDKREANRANKRKKHRRNRHYVKTMLRHLGDQGVEVSDEVSEEDDLLNTAS